jgi:predicted  nucleic acid-binding Zn-ribbon protein
MSPVKDLLRQLITRLEEELSAETSHKEWCDTEKAQSAEAKAARETMITNLQAEIPQLNTQISTLGGEIEFAEGQLANNAAETTEATKVREEAKAAFETSKADHDEVISALESAVSALSSVTFVQTKAKSRRILQQHRDGQPEKGNPFAELGSSQAGSAVEMLTDLLNRYTSARSQAITEEEQSVKAHKQFLEESETFRTLTLQTKQSQSQEKRMKEDRLSDAESELIKSGQELQQVTQYIADLAPSCDDIRVSFEERKHRREAEIQALKEALQVLDEMAQAR